MGNLQDLDPLNADVDVYAGFLKRDPAIGIVKNVQDIKNGLINISIDFIGQRLKYILPNYIRSN